MKELKRLLFIVGIFIFLLSSFCVKGASSYNSLDVNIVKDSLIVEEYDYDHYFDLGIKLMREEKFGDLQLRIPLKKALSILGNPDEKGEMVLWSSDGEYHQSFVYTDKGITLDVIGEKEADKIMVSIDAVSPCTLKTSSGIGIGSSYNELVNTYKDYLIPGEYGPDYVVAGTLYGGILFILEDEKVVQIFFGIAVGD